LSEKKFTHNKSQKQNLNSLFLVRKLILFLTVVCLLNELSAQPIIQVNPSQLPAQSTADFRPGVFFVPKTQDGFNTFFSSNTCFNGVRLNIIESALNNSSNLTQCLAFLEQFRTAVLAVNQRCQHLVLIFEKMPAWLSSSSNSSPAQTQGWSVLNTKPPASSWALYNLGGQKVQSGADVRTSEFSIPVYSLPNGVYLLYIETAEGRRQERITVQH
jgi:hypothetical protein